MSLNIQPLAYDFSLYFVIVFQNESGESSLLMLGINRLGVAIKIFLLISHLEIRMESMCGKTIQ